MVSIHCENSDNLRLIATSNINKAEKSNPDKKNTSESNEVMSEKWYLWKIYCQSIMDKTNKILTSLESIYFYK